LIDALEKARPEGSSVYERLAQAQPLERDAIDDAAPFTVPAPIESIGMFKSQEGFCLSVPGLLPKISFGGLPAMVPDKCPWGVSDPLAGLLKTPTDIHIIAGFAKLWIKSI
jgi:hypothetical protein